MQVFNTIKEAKSSDVYGSRVVVAGKVIKYQIILIS